MRAALEANAATAPKLNKATATRAADATAQLRTAITEWFNFYNGYDPLFTWWMAMPFKQLDAALQEYATFLRDKVAAADAPVAGDAGHGAARPARSRPEVRLGAGSRGDHRAAPGRDARHRRAVQRRRPVAAARRTRRARWRGRSGGAGAAGGPTTRFYTAWLAALKSLDFDRLSRNAQVDYLYIKWTAETEIKRAGTSCLPARRARPTPRTSRDVRAAAPA